MPGVKAPYRNKMKTPAKVIGRIALDLIRAYGRTRASFDSNIYSGGSVSFPDPDGFMHDVLSPTHEDSDPDVVVRGDLITGQYVNPLWARLAKGNVDDVLTMVDADDPDWAPPAVVPHDILDSTAHSDSVSDAVTRGSLIVGNATPKWDELNKGTINQVLTMVNGSDPDWADSQDEPKTFYVNYTNITESTTGQLVAPQVWADETFNEIDLLNQVDIPRGIAVHVTPGVGTCEGTVTINGIDADGAVIQEVLTFDTAIEETQNTVRAFINITSIVVDKTGSSTTLYEIGTNEMLGVPNYPFNSTSDVFKVNKAGLHYIPASYIVNATYGTITDSAAVAAATFEIWYRPDTPVVEFLLLENGDFVLLENGDKIVLE